MFTIADLIRAKAEKERKEKRERQYEFMIDVGGENKETIHKIEQILLELETKLNSALKEGLKHKVIYDSIKLGIFYGGELTYMSVHKGVHGYLTGKEI
jgi:hypothetical protein